jgi:hypothetical protein
MKVTMKVEGLRQCEAALTDLVNTTGVSRATGKNTLRRAMRFALEPVREGLRGAAPVFRGRLKAGIDTSTQLSKRQRAQHVKQDPVEMFVGARPHRQAHMTEFGTAHMPPQGWARKVVDALISTVVERFKSQLWLEIQRTAERHARKMQRLTNRST